MIERAQGCLLGQLAGDSLGSLVEFMSAEDIREAYPNGVRELADGGVWNTIAGQPTDDSEMAIILARTLVAHGPYDSEEAMKAYVFWLDSDPFDCGMTIAGGLQGEPDRTSQANGAMMRVSPLGIFGATVELPLVAEWARRDAALTHPNPVCLHANALYAMAIALAVRTGIETHDLYDQIVSWAKEMDADAILMDAIIGARTAPPSDYVYQQGWVLIAFRNALWQLLNRSDVESAVVDTVMRGSDTDTNGAICGALLGAVYGRDAIPAQWVDRILDCRPEAGQPGIHRPRPECFWPVDSLALAEQLVSGAA